MLCYWVTAVGPLGACKKYRLLGLTADQLSVNLSCSRVQSSAHAGPILMTIYKFIEALKAKGKDPLAVECVFIKLFQDTGSQTLCEELMHRLCRWMTSVWLLFAFWLVCRAVL